MSVLLRDDGVRIHYEIAGSGPALLMTHGFTGSAEDFAKSIDALARTHTVITWDLRGHGESDAPLSPDAYSVPLALGDMAALLDTAGAERAVLAGHSLGGFLSLEFHLAHRSRVSGLILIGTGPGFRSDAPRGAWNDRVERIASGLELRGRPVDRGLAFAARGILAQHDGRVLESLSDIAVPTLVVVGEQDEVFLGGSRYMAGKIPGARLDVLANAGHPTQMDQPAAFDRVVTDFLKRLDPR